MGSIIKFINHACVCIETKKSLLVTDPWLEGKVFNNGWSLLDDSTSNEKLLNELKTKNKKIFIWYSHEHPDHLSFSFLKLLKDYNLDCHIFYLVYEKILKGPQSQAGTYLPSQNYRRIFLYLSLT